MTAPLPPPPPPPPTLPLPPPPLLRSPLVSLRHCRVPVHVTELLPPVEKILFLICGVVYYLFLLLSPYCGKLFLFFIAYTGHDFQVLNHFWYDFMILG